MNPLLLLRAASVLLLARLAGRFVNGLVSGLRGEQAGAAAGGGARAGGEMVRDLVCNTFLPRERALRAVIAGQEAHFCSSACRDRALALWPRP